jgi:2-polyprenyl-6-methoxyphenol hydroxylase-like FAD-dependent oxidoreductase
VVGLDGRQVVVVGGAVGGLAAALLLARAGATVTVLERVAEPAAVGAGILLQPNGLAVLAGLGLDGQLEEAGHRMGGAGVVRSATGTPLAQVRVPDFGAGLDHVLALRRSRLHELLLAAVRSAHPAVALRLGTEVTGVARDGTVRFEAGGVAGDVAGDLVVGADGVGSVVRAGGDFGARARPGGATYLRGLVPGDDLGLEGEWWTPLGLFGGAPMGDGSSYFYASATRPPVAAALAASDLAGLRAGWAAALPLAGRVLERVQGTGELLVNQVVRVDCERWNDGRLVLCGDAAHAMAPTLGQGANSALVDAAVLAVELAGDGPPEAALARYGARRRPAVRRVQDTADRLARLADLASPPLRRARDVLLRAASGFGSDRRVRAFQQEDPARLLDAVRRLGRAG